MSLGTNYGLNDSLEYTEFEFDSFDCNQAKNEEFYTTDWPNFYVGKPLDNVAAIKILEAQVPFTFYIFNSKNSTFVLTEMTLGGVHASSVYVTIPQGNYTFQTLPTVLDDILNTASPGLFTYTTNFSVAMGTISISNSDTTTGDYFIFSFGQDLGDPGRTNPRIALGFSGGQNISSLAPDCLLQAPSVLQLAGPSYVYLCSTALGGLIHLYLPGNGIINPSNAGADGPQIAKIPLVVNSGEVTNWLDPNPLMWFDTGNTPFNGNIDFYVTLGTNAFNDPIEFNGASFSVKLGVLQNKSSHNDWLGGGKQNDRVQQRTWSTGGRY